MISGTPKFALSGVPVALGGLGLGATFMPLWLLLTIAVLLLTVTAVALVRYGWRRGKPVNAR
jgi:hypothetical protein